MEKRRLIAAIILNKNNEVLLQKKDLTHTSSPGKWCFFGGELEQGKSHEQALKEILKRKTGIEFDNFEFFKEHEFKIECNDGIIEGTDMMYVCRFNKKISDIKLTEGAGFAFFDKSELGSLNLTKHGLKILQEFFGSKP